MNPAEVAADHARRMATDPAYVANVTKIRRVVHPPLDALELASIMMAVDQCRASGNGWLVLRADKTISCRESRNVVVSELPPPPPLSEQVVAQARAAARASGAIPEAEEPTAAKRTRIS